MTQCLEPLRIFSIAALALLFACGEEAGREESEAIPPPAMPEARSGSMVEDAAMDVVAFLQGTAQLDSSALADSVTLYVSPEGGGGRTAYRSSELRERSSWTVTSGARSIALAPPRANTRMTTKPGKHLNCREYDLATRYPELSRYPHVGVRLDPDPPGSCLQAWNLTLVYDAAAKPRLIAAVYDQWEW